MGVSRTVVLLWLVLFLTGSGSPGGLQAEDRRLDRSRLTVMTFNTEFLWDGVPPEEGEASFPHKGSREKAEEHMRGIAEVIRRANPDMVTLLEVENLRALHTLNEKFLRGLGYRPFLKKGRDWSTGQDAGLLTRIDPLDGVVVYDGRPGRSGTQTYRVTKNVVAKFAIGSSRIALLGVHLRSQPTAPDRKLMRQAQADAMVAISTDLRRQGYSLIVMGDFNDFDASPEAIDHIDSRPITDVLARVRALDPADPTDDLVNAAAFVPQRERFTCFYDRNRNGRVDPPREFNSIDHLLLSKELAAKVESVRIPRDHDTQKVSDHYPIVVRLRLPRCHHR
ncbi:MAG: endonuclease/exonuclease/phosphatase family protein [Candidatus Riflebacteria bacterium]|nr:endonuclease/exonuclease/phosphatase family protein [Candidatus Riflebacteria bacterium]